MFFLLALFAAAASAECTGLTFSSCNQQTCDGCATTCVWVTTSMVPADGKQQQQVKKRLPGDGQCECPESICSNPLPPPTTSTTPTVTKATTAWTTTTTTTTDDATLSSKSRVSPTLSTEAIDGFSAPPKLPSSAKTTRSDPPPFTLPPVGGASSIAVSSPRPLASSSSAAPASVTDRGRADGLLDVRAQAGASDAPTGPAADSVPWWAIVVGVGGVVLVLVAAVLLIVHKRKAAQTASPATTATATTTAATPASPHDSVAVPDRSRASSAAFSAGYAAPSLEAPPSMYEEWGVKGDLQADNKIYA